MSESDIRLRLYMRLAAVESADLAADVTRVTRMVEAFLSAPALAAATKAQVDDKRVKKVTAATRAEVAATGRDAIEYFDHRDDAKQAVWAQFSLGSHQIDLRCVLAGKEIAKHRATALDDLTAAFVRAAEVWRGV